MKTHSRRKKKQTFALQIPQLRVLLTPAAGVFTDIERLGHDSSHYLVRGIGMKNTS